MQAFTLTAAIKCLQKHSLMLVNIITVDILINGGTHLTKDKQMESQIPNSYLATRRSDKYIF